MSTDFQAGTRIGQYVLDAHVGGGSFGAVWRGHDENSGQLVAIKLLTGALANSDSIATRADVEVLAAAAARRSPHVVKVLDGGTDPLPYIVMEFIEGDDLQTMLHDRGNLSQEETIDVGLAISDALQALYQAGIVHRDIKPANVMKDSDGVIKLADFGIAKIVGYETITTAGQAPMTMAYAAPEIWNDGGQFGHPSHRSDLYAMGVLLYQCLTGFTPFRGNYGALYRAHMEQTPDITALPAETPPSLRTLIRRCLEKQQEDRPQDALECQNILKRAQAELASLTGSATINEPKKLGPWIKDAPHDTFPWAWRCHHDTTGQVATVEVHFAAGLEYGATLRKAIAVNAKLTPFGAERLLETNRLLLHPNEAWWEPPPGQFQFWIAREDLAVTPAELVTEAILAPAVKSLAGLIDTAAAERVALDLRSSNLTLQQHGDLYLRRPGLCEPAEDAQTAAVAYLAALPLDAAARELVTAATGLNDLASRLAERDTGATIIADLTQILPRAAQDAGPPPAVSQPAVQADLTPPAAPRRPTPAAPAPAKKSPIVLIAGVAVVAMIAIVAFLVFGGGSGDKNKDASSTDEAPALVDKGGAAASPAAQKTVVSNPANLTARPEGREYVDRTVLVETNDTLCSDGSSGCRTVYSVGPYRFKGNTLRIEFSLQVVAPAGKGIEWEEDMAVDRRNVANGYEGVQLNGESGKVWRIVAAGGIAGQSNKSLVAGKYTGYWDFIFEEKPGATLTFSYPDFEDYITIYVPDLR